MELKNEGVDSVFHIFKKIYLSYGEQIRLRDSLRLEKCEVKVN